MKPTEIIELDSGVDAVHPLTDGRLVAAAAHGTVLITGTRVEPLPPTPLRWPDRKERWAAAVWEERDGAIQPLPHTGGQGWAHVISTASPPRLLQFPDTLGFRHAFPGRPGEVIALG